MRLKPNILLEHKLFKKAKMEVNKMARLTKEEMDSLKAIGKEINFDFELSPQAKAIMERFDNFPILHFKAWWKKHYGTINGQHLHHYFSVSDGIAEVQK